MALVRKNNSVVDSFWGLSFIITAIAAVASYGFFEFPQILITSMVIIWGSRLSIRIFTRNRGKPEDFRYAQWRKDWGRSAALKSYTNVFLIQGIVCLIVSIPVIIVNTHMSNVRRPILLIFGVAVWLTGFLFESISDAQLDAFKEKRTDKDKVLDSGLWRYSRHPNYFGESVIWFGIAIVAINFDSSKWWLFISPLLITFLLLKVSGVPLLEKKMSLNPKYKDYIKKTNKFIPGPPKD